MVLPTVAVGATVTWRVATWLPGSGALLVNGIRLVPSEKVSRRVMVPALDGLDSNAGVSGAVMPPRVKVTDCTEAVGA